MKRRDYLTISTGSLLLLSGCLGPDDTDDSDGSNGETEISSYPVGFAESNISGNTIGQNQFEQIANTDSATIELVVSEPGYTERTVSTKQGETHSVSVYINEQNKPRIERISQDDTTYIKDETQYNKYTVENGKVISTETLVQRDILQKILDSIIVEAQQLENGETIVYNITGTNNTSELNDVFSTVEDQSFSGQLYVNQESGFVEEITLESSNLSLQYTAEKTGSIDTSWLSDARSQIPDISASVDSNNVFSITVQDAQLEANSSLVIIPSGGSTYQTQFSQQISQNSTIYVGLSDSNVNYTVDEPITESDFPDTAYTLILLDSSGSEVKRFTLQQ